MNIFDLHNDILTSGFTDYELQNRVNREWLNNNKIICAIWTTLLSMDEFVLKSKYVRDNKIISAIEDCQVLSDDFDIMLISKPLYCSLTWNLDNSLGGGAYGKNGLTEKGKSFIEFLNKHNIALDLSHLNEKTFWQAIDIADRVLVSHSALNVLKKHCRNLNDLQIEAIIKKDGIIGLTPVPDFIANGNIKGYLDAVEYFIKKFGNKNISIGSDFYGTKGIVGLENYCELIQSINNLVADEKICRKILFDNASGFFNII